MKPVSQVDLVGQYGRPAFGLEYYAQAEDLGQLADLMAEGGPTGAAFPPRFRRLTSALCEVRLGSAPRLALFPSCLPH